LADQQPDKGARLLKSGSIVSAMTLLSRVLGFVRDQVFAILLGAGPMTDAFFVAFKIPNFLRRLFAEGAFAQSFVPVFTEYKEKYERRELRELAASVSGTLGLLLLILSILGSMCAPWLVSLFAPGFEEHDPRRQLTTDMLRITFPYLFFISLVAYAGGAALWGTQFFSPSVVALAWGVFAAGALQLLFQLPTLHRLGLLVLPRWGWQHSGVKKIRELMLPAIFGSSVAQINLLLDTIIASFLVAGSVSWLYYADRLVEFPLGVFGIAIATVILPRLSAIHAQDNRQGFQHTMDWAVRLGVVIALPCSAGLLLLSTPMLATLFGYGEFSANDVTMSSWSLKAYALALPGFILVKILAPGFFARQNTKTPVRIGVIAMVCNMGYNIVLVGSMVLLALPAAHTGLALATALSANQQAFMLLRQLGRESAYSLSADNKRIITGAAIATVVMAVVIYLITPDAQFWTVSTASTRVARLVVIIVAAALTYGAALLLLRIHPRDLLPHR